MCIVSFRWAPESDEPLLLAANRDEFYERPTERMHWWPGDELLAGRDLRSGGAWLGITRHGRFAMITNIRDPALRLANAPSRGDLVRQYLVGDEAPEAFLARCKEAASRYEGFNLLCGSLRSGSRSLWFFHSRDASAQAVSPGLHGLSNATLDTPWPKLLRLQDGMKEALAVAEANTRPERLLGLLRDTTPTPDEELPNTGVPFVIERMLGSVFISSDNYGTRASTLLSVGEERVDASEIGYHTGGEPLERRNFRFSLSPR